MALPSNCVRSFPRMIILAAVACAAVSAAGQINGVPSSVTSYGFGGHFSQTPGFASSVTSLGPNGYGRSPFVYGRNFGASNCCLNSFPRRHREGFLPYAVPVYVPYTQVVEIDANDSPDDYVEIAPRRRPRPTLDPGPDEPPAPRPHPAEVSKPAEPTPPAPPEPEQLATIVVFKDGHQLELKNYAIVGDTLFDLSIPRRKIALEDLDVPATQKRNDERGLDFRLPLATAAN